SVDGARADIDEWQLAMLTNYCCGEFRDQLYAAPMLPAMQDMIGFEEGECLMVRLGAFGMGRQTATWNIYDLKKGVISEGVITEQALSQVDAFPSQSLKLLLE
ncbi:unnamed protein product, partial [Polarella glacialis]